MSIIRTLYMGKKKKKWTTGHKTMDIKYKTHSKEMTFKIQSPRPKPFNTKSGV